MTANEGARVDLDALQKLADEATPGPWVQIHPTPWGSRVIFNESGEMYVGVSARTAVPTEGWSDEARQRAYELGARKCADARFIAAAREAVPALIARIRELEATSHIREAKPKGAPECLGSQ